MTLGKQMAPPSTGATGTQTALVGSEEISLWVGACEASSVHWVRLRKLPSGALSVVSP